MAFKPNISLGVFSTTWTRHFPCRCIQVRITAGWWHSWEWTTVSHNNVLLSHSAVLKYFMHSSPHQEASSLQNVGHTTETRLPMHSANPSCLAEEAAYWFGTPSKQTLQITKPSQWQRKRLHRQMRTMTQVVKQKLWGYFPASHGNLFA